VIADVVFDVPVPHPFSYRVPEGWTLAPGQRVAAPLGGGERVGVVLALREDDGARLKPLARLVDQAPLLPAGRLDLARWIAGESLSSLGSTLAALLPPAARDARGHAPAGESARETGPVRDDARPVAGGGAPRPELLIGAGRERALLERIERGQGALVLVPDVDAAGRWAQRLARIDRVARLDSGAEDAERVEAWRALARGDVRLAVGTRSALLAPLPAGASLALVDEHEGAHRPPGPPRIHARAVVLERAAREGRAARLTSATPAVETWWQAERGALARPAHAQAPWPAVSVADTRGILKVEPLTPPLARAIRETLAAGRRVLLVVSRLTSALACDECGTVVRCPECALALAYARGARALVCRLCGREVPTADTCERCRGRRLTPFGWGLDRVEHAVRRRFPRARVARFEPDTGRRGGRAAGRAAAAAADVVIGSRGALHLFGPASLGLAGFVTPDQTLRLPDFRAGERLFALLWGAAERVGAAGGLVIQSQNPEHYAFTAAARADLAAFYRDELRFREELGYPPFRRLAVVAVGAAGDARGLVDDVHAALGALRTLTVYPPSSDRRARLRRIVIKGGADLPHALAQALAEFRGRRRRGRGIIDVEVDPVEWPF
jgi:primosomal protein N' (replication factor Y)